MAQKRLILPALALAVAAALSACAPAEETPSMQLSRAELSQAEEDIVSLLQLGGTGFLLDYAVDETAGWLEITTYELDEQDNWVSIRDGGVSIEHTAGRLAFWFDTLPDGYRVSFQSEEGTSAAASLSETPADLDGLNKGTVSLSSPAEIVYGEEIPVAVQIVTAKNGIRTLDLTTFSDPVDNPRLDYEHVYALTLTFFQEAP